MKKYFLSLIVILATSTVFAQQAEGEDKLSPEEIQKTYDFQCGSVADVIRSVKAENPDMKDELSADELKELIQTRSVMLDVLKNGAPAVQKMLEQGSKSDTGPFGALIACSMIDVLSEKISSEGCLDLSTGERISGGPGIDVCKEMVKKLKK